VRGGEKSDLRTDDKERGKTPIGESEKGAVSSKKIGCKVTEQGSRGRGHKVQRMEYKPG